MKNIVFILLLGSLLSLSAFARCNGSYADNLIGFRFGNACIEIIKKSGDFDSACGEGVQSVCEDGCYDAMFNASLKPGCDYKYQKALEANRCNDFLINSAKAASCKDTGKYSNNNNKLPDPNTACTLNNVIAVQATCGGIVDNAPPTCGGPGGGKYICLAEVTCREKFALGENVYNPKSYTATALSNNAKCSDFDINVAFADVNILTGTKQIKHKPTNAEKALDELTNPGN